MGVDLRNEKYICDSCGLSFDSINDCPDCEHEYCYACIDQLEHRCTGMAVAGEVDSTDVAARKRR